MRPDFLMFPRPFARFDSLRPGGRSFEFRGLRRAISTESIGGVVPALQEVEEEVGKGGHAVGFLSYEAAGALDASLRTRARDPDVPLLWFGVFAERVPAAPIRHDGAAAELELGEWRSSLSQPEHAQRVGEIRELIAAGDTYQVNFTFQLKAALRGSDVALYERLCLSQRGGYCALLRIPGLTVASASPELFFRWEGRELELRPMKGTRPRGRWAEEDEAQMSELLGSEKEQAENLMIVDLLRNDAGRIAEYGSVRTHSLFQVESYPTVHQLTSTIRARTREGVILTDVLRALFPCGSVTGAPKVRTMEIIAALEEAPRGVYTGAIGFYSPGEAVFNVPIRTLVIDEQGTTVRMGVGSGVTYDSDAEAEYRECLQKAAFTHHPVHEFDLLETMLRLASGEIFLLEEHLARLAASARYFGFSLDLATIRERLDDTEGTPGRARRLRLLLGRGGEVRVEESALVPLAVPLRACLAANPVDSRDVMLYHKTTCRRPYDDRLASHPDCDEVILRNERDELTELINGNLVVRKDGESWTPPLRCGLLPGTFRAHLLREGRIRERVLVPG
ncbi:MAG: aminodeoxychorismate synthase component I, partial [Gemmatimonadetes bacterium]|nr:aminodeoxychorismate synthase component I [Gemmatimonadota bacterium]